MKPATHPEALRVQAVLGPRFQVVEFETSTKTSADAAAAVGCSVAQIAKSIVFRTAQSNLPVLVVASGVNRIDEKKVAAAIGEKVKSASPEFVLEHAGFAVGGVPPIGHKNTPIVVLDQDLQRYQEIWAAGGTSNAVFRLTWDELVALTSGKATEIAKP